MIPRAFSRKIVLPNLIALHEKFCDGVSVFDDAFPSDFVRLPLFILLLSIVPWRGGEFGRWLFGRVLDEIGGMGHVEGAVEYHLKNFIKTNKAVIDHQAIRVFLTLAQPILGADFHGVQEFCGKLAAGSYVSVEDYFLELDGSGD